MKFKQYINLRICIKSFIFYIFIYNILLSHTYMYCLFFTSISKRIINYYIVS